MNTKTEGCAAEQAASFLLTGTNLSAWQVGFLAVALDEVAEGHERCEMSVNIGKNRAAAPILFRIHGKKYRKSCECTMD